MLAAFVSLMSKSDASNRAGGTGRLLSESVHEGSRRAALFSCACELPAPVRLPALVMVNVFERQVLEPELAALRLGEDARSLQQSLDANRFSAR